MPTARMRAKAPMAPAIPTAVATMTCLRRTAVILEWRMGLIGYWLIAQIGRAPQAERLNNSESLRDAGSFQLHHFSHDPFGGDDQEHQGVVEGAGPEFYFEIRSDLGGF